MKNPDKLLHDASLRHAVLLEQLKTGEVEQLQDYYREIDKIVRERLTRKDLTEYNAKSLKEFLKTTQEQIAEVLNKSAANLNASLDSIALYEAEFEVKSLQNAITGYNFKVNTVSNTVIRTSLATAPLQVSGIDSGKVIKDVLKSLTNNESARITNAIKLGVAQGKTNNEIIQYIRGKKEYKYTDGILNVSKKQAEAATRTLISHAANTAKEDVYKANSDVVIGVKLVATLDKRTSTICRSLDGRIFKVGEGVRPPLHINCRTTEVAVTRLSEMFSKGATRASEYGQVSADLIYYDWLKQQSSSYQDQVLGKTRGKLFRDGGLSAKRFAELQLDRYFRPITLAQMKELEPLAFEKAGL